MVTMINLNMLHMSNLPRYLNYVVSLHILCVCILW